MPDPLRRAWQLVRAILVLVRRGLVALVTGGRRHPRRVAALAGVLALLGASYLVVRHSSLSAVRRVEVSGVSGMDSGAIQSALITAAQHQSTLGVNVGALRAAVAPYHLVSALRVSASFPHTLRITVAEQLPVATLRDGSQQVVVAADGAVLDPSVAAGAAPTIDVTSLPAGHVIDPQLLAELTILGAAPPVMLHRIARIYPSPNGFAVSMRNGLVIFFGDTTLPHAKWLSAARVIASPLAVGATYVDVRVPDHPAAGGLTPGASDAGTTTTLDANDASIAAALTSALGPGSGGAASAGAGTGAATGTGASTATGTVATGAGTATGIGTGTGAATGTGTGTDTGTATGTGTGTGAGAGAGAGTGTGAGTGSAGGGATSAGGTVGAGGAGTATGGPVAP